LAIAERKINHRKKQSRVLIQNLVFLVFWAALFTLAYAQSPLYTSNQNQYFLHGLARAGYGFLHEDWLANTLDPTPVFSKFIEINWRALPWPPIFYLYFGALAGVYLFSVLGITKQLWGLDTRPERWLYLAILGILHSAALRYLIARGLGLHWDYLLDGGVAGQRLLGTVLQPSTFGVFLVLSIYLFLRARRGWAVFWLLVATTFHPTYLLSAGILTAVYMAITYWETREWRAPLALGVGALIGVAPILWHTLNTFGPTSPELTAQSRAILVDFRIPHHAVVVEWFNASVLVKVGFVVLALIILIKKPPAETPRRDISTRQKLFHILLWPALIAVSLTLMQVATRNVTLALLFPWRLSAWLVPLSVSLIAGWCLVWCYARFQLEHFPRRVLAASLVTALIFAAAGTAKFRIARQTKHSSPDRPMMRYVEAHKASGEVYLIPIKMQDFRLETGAPAYVEFKSIPYKDADVLEWRERIRIADNFYYDDRCSKLERLSAEGITHLVLSAGHTAGECQGVETLYQDEYYGVFELPSP
jgi:hypothetical protein